MKKRGPHANNPATTVAPPPSSSASKRNNSASAAAADGDKNTPPFSATKEEHFQDVSRALSFLRKCEAQTDLRFVMAANRKSSKLKDGGSGIVFAHKAIFARHSALLTEIFNIAEKKQPGQEVFINVPDVDALVMEKLVQYLYLGQTTTSKEVRGNIESLCQTLGLKISLDTDESVTNSDSDDGQPSADKKKSRLISSAPEKGDGSANEDGLAKPPETVPAKKKPGRPKKATANAGESSPPSKRKASQAPASAAAAATVPKVMPSILKRSLPPPSPSSSDEEGDSDKKEKKKKQQPGISAEEMDKLIEEARKSRPRVRTESVDRSQDEEVKKYYKKATSSADDKEGSTDAEERSPPSSPLPPAPPEPASSSPPPPPAPPTSNQIFAANPLFSGKGAAAAATSSADNASGTKKANAAASGPTPTPQKRRMTESDKKVARSESKKMRQDSESASSGGVDVEAVARRKNEALIGEAAEGATNDAAGKNDKRKKSDLTREGGSSGSETERNGPAAKKVEKKKPRPKPASAKNAKPGPKTKKAAAAPPVAPPKEADMFTTEAVQYCNDCDAIFLSLKALKDHRDSKHAYDGVQEGKAGGRISGGSDSDSSSSLSSNTAKGKSTKKTSAQIKKERNKSRLVSSSSSSGKGDSSEDEDGPSKAPKTSPAQKKPGRPPKSASNANSGKESTPGKATSGRKQGVTPRMTGSAPRQCLLCPMVFDKTQKFKEHVLNHYKPELNIKLPNGKPFACPDCGSYNRDKITLLRHYAFTHKHIYDVSNESELAGKPAEASAISTINGSAKSKKAKTEATLDSSSSSSSSSSDSESERANKKRKSVEKEDDKEDAEKTDPVPAPSTIKFSDDSDDDFASAAANASETLKNFDDLIKDDKPDKGGTGDDKKLVKEGKKDESDSN